jgi:hypothetical protein
LCERFVRKLWRLCMHTVCSWANQCIISRRILRYLWDGDVLLNGCLLLRFLRGWALCSINRCFVVLGLQRWHLLCDWGVSMHELLGGNVPKLHRGHCVLAVPRGLLLRLHRPLRRHRMRCRHLLELIGRDRVCRLQRWLLRCIDGVDQLRGVPSLLVRGGQRCGVLDLPDGDVLCRGKHLATVLLRAVASTHSSAHKPADSTPHKPTNSASNFRPERAADPPPNFRTNAPSNLKTKSAPLATSDR